MNNKIIALATFFLMGQSFAMDRSEEKTRTIKLKNNRGERVSFMVRQEVTPSMYDSAYNFIAEYSGGHFTPIPKKVYMKLGHLEDGQETSFEMPEGDLKGLGKVSQFDDIVATFDETGIDVKEEDYVFVSCGDNPEDF